MESLAALDEALTEPSEALNAFVEGLDGPLLVLGAGGKMGPSLCGMVKRAADHVGNALEIIAVSRFSDRAVEAWLEARDIQTVRSDLFDETALARLPDARHIIYLVGLKFGTQQNPSLTWAANTLVPAHIAQRYPDSRIVALSTGNVYPLVDIQTGGSVETDAVTPLGEYANACVARERIFEHFTRVSPLHAVMIRLNYAVEMRYGVLVDLAQKVASGKPVDVTMGYFNCIWQRDANEMIVRALALAESPAVSLNLTGLETHAVREIALRLGELMGKPVKIAGQEAPTALLNNAARAHRLLPIDPLSIDQMLQWTAEWVLNGGELLGKSTNFEVRDGKF